MKKLEFKKEINATATKVWDILWSESTYTQWTAAFNPKGLSTVQSDWKVGGKTLFLDGQGNGMISTIKSMNEPHEMVFEHLGEVINGVEDTTSEKVKNWAGSLEEYHLDEKDGVTMLTATVTSSPEWESMLTNGFTNGLQIVKELAETE